MSALATAVIEVPDLSSLRSATDAELSDALRRCAEARKRVDAVLAALSGEVERRSARDRGAAGLAQSSGARWTIRARRLRPTPRRCRREG